MTTGSLASKFLSSGIFSFALNLESMTSAALRPTSLRKGVKAIDKTTTMMSSLFNSSGRTPSLFAREKTTKANSPPCERSNPIRTLSCKESPTRGPMAVIINVLITISPPKRERTLGHSRTRSWMSIDVPVVTKKRPRSRPLNGRMSASI
eukprot:Gb_08654 [translate_table: standard]